MNSAQTVLRATRIALGAAATVALIVSVSGCSAHSDVPARASQPTPVAASPEASHATWPRFDVSGTGPQTVTVPVPSNQARYFVASFGCTSGKGTVTLVEDTRVFEGETCGGPAEVTTGFGGIYQMPIPHAQVLHFTVDVPADAKFRFAGDFE